MQVVNCRDVNTSSLSSGHTHCQEPSFIWTMLKLQHEYHQYRSTHCETDTVIPCYDNWDKHTLVSTEFDITLL